MMATKTSHISKCQIAAVVLIEQASAKVSVIAPPEVIAIGNSSGRFTTKRYSLTLVTAT